MCIISIVNMLPSSDLNRYPKGQISNKINRLPITDLNMFKHRMSAPTLKEGKVKAPSINLISKKDFKEMHKRKQESDLRIGTLKLL